MKRSTKILFAASCAIALSASRLFAQAPTFTFDEFGNIAGPAGFAVPPGTLQPDPSGGIAPQPVLVYTLPFSVITGDVIFTNSEPPGQSPISDLVRFWDPTGGNVSQMIVYSDFSSSDPPDAPADTGLPTTFIGNPFVTPEIGPEGNNGGTWTPTAGEPGYAGSALAYHLISDGVVPEPGTITLAALGGGLLLLQLKRRQRAGA
jgi:hypothetical protein